MTETTTSKTVKSSVSIRKNNWEILKWSKNKSKTINEALDFFFRFQDKIESSKKSIYSQILDEALAEVDRWEVYDVPQLPNWEIDRKAFSKMLWS
jgi:hypothetical protein